MGWARVQIISPFSLCTRDQTLKFITYAHAQAPSREKKILINSNTYDFVTASLRRNEVLFWTFNTWKPSESLGSNFSWQYQPWIKCKSNKKNGNDHQFKKLPTGKQIFLVITVGNTERTVQR